MSRSGSMREQVYDFLTEYVSLRGYPPTVREICAATGLRSTASVHYHLQALAREGRIDLEENKNRAISLPVSRERGMVPLVGTVAAGRPILAVEQIEGYIPWDRAEGLFALRVKGDSMIEAGILPGDKVIVQPQQTADNGDIVVALLEDEATVKRLSRKNGRVWLLPENPAYAPIDGTEAVILGRVKGVVREY